MTSDRPPSPFDPAPRRDFAILAAAFVLARIAAALLGVRFNLSTLTYFFQYIDVLLLRTDLLHSVWLLHSQPPLFNLFIGIGAKLPAAAEIAYFQSAYLLLGGFSALALHGLCTELGLSRRLRLAVTLLWIANPTAILYENVLIYSLPEQVLVLATLVGALRWLRGGPRRWLWLACLSSSALVLARSFFHPAWYVLGAAMLVVLSPGRRGRTATAFGIGAVPILAWCLKNALLFGFFGTSSWLGMSLAKATVSRIPVDVREEWIADGTLAATSRIPPFSPSSDYRKVVPEVPERGHPLLDDDWKSSADPNRHSLVYLEASRLCMQDSLGVIRRDPGVYAHSCLDSLDHFFRNQPRYMEYVSGDKTNVPALERWSAIYDALVLGAFGSFAKGDESRCWFIALAWAAAICIGGVQIARLRPGCDPSIAAAAFCAATMIYVLVVSSTAEVGENFRFRFVADPLAFAMAAWVGRSAVAALRRRMAAEPA